MKTIYLLAWLINGLILAFIVPRYDSDLATWMYFINICIPVALLVVRTVWIFSTITDIKQIDKDLII